MPPSPTDPFFLTREPDVPTAHSAMILIRRLAALAIGCLTLLAAPAIPHAADDTDQEPAAAEAPEPPVVTVTARRLNESLEDPAAFVDVIRLDQYAGRLVDTEEVLRQAAGVNVRSFGGLGSYATVSIRGSSADQVVVLVDGIRLNSTAGGGVDLNSIPPEQIERIEVLRGGESSLYGEGAIGGVVNIITKRGAGATANQASLTTGSYDTWRLAASRGGGTGQWRYYAGGSFFHTAGDYRFENDNGTTLDESDDFTDVRRNNELESRSLLLQAGYSPIDPLDLAAQNELYSSDAGVPGLVTFPSPHAHQKLLRELPVVSAAWTGLGLAGLSGKTQLSLRYERAQFRDGYGEQTGVPLASDRTETEPAAEQSFYYAWGEHQLWNLTGVYRHTALAGGDFGGPTRDAWGAALGDQAFLWARRVTLTGNVRYDGISEVDGAWSPKGGLALQPWDWLTVKGNIGRSFRAPNFSELYFNQGLVIGNPDLSPERALHFDGGLQLSWLPYFFTEGAYFRSEVKDLIEYQLVDGFRYKPFNVGRARLEGLELSARTEATRYLALSGAYTLTYAIDETPGANRRGRQLPGRPRHVGFGRATGTAGIFSPFVEFNYVAGNYVTPANTKLLPERRLWNAGLVVSPDEHARIGWEMKNLADERVVDVRGFPLPGRSVYLTFDYSF